MVNKESRTAARENKHRRLRNRLAGTAERPRLAVFRSNNHMYAQICLLYTSCSWKNCENKESYRSVNRR